MIAYTPQPCPALSSPVLAWPVRIHSAASFRKWSGVEVLNTYLRCSATPVAGVSAVLVLWCCLLVSTVAAPACCCYYLLLAPATTVRRSVTPCLLLTSYSCRLYCYLLLLQFLPTFYCPLSTRCFLLYASIWLRSPAHSWLNSTKSATEAKPCHSHQ